MIPENFVEHWRENAPWQTLEMVEQDLVISRALVDLYNNEAVQNNLVFRGGTALNKLYIQPAARYSEDIDFVQRSPAPIGEALDGIRSVLDGWLGEPRRKLTERGAKLIYRYSSVDNVASKLKIEINTTEHFQVLELIPMSFEVRSKWYEGQCVINTYQLNELMATKLRALYQRRKGRDLFDIWYVCYKGMIDIDKMIKIFFQYCEREGIKISKDLFCDNLFLKRSNKDFQSDMTALLSPEMKWDFDEAFDYVLNHVICKL